MSETTTEVVPEATPTPKGNEGDWKDKEIRDLRDEAAGRRVENNNLKSQVAELSGQVQTNNTQVTELTTRAETAESSLLKLTVALKAGVPGDQAAEFAELLVGSTEQELTEYANKIRKFNGGHSPAFDPSQGRGANDGTSTPLTPEQEFAAALERQLNFR